MDLVEINNGVPTTTSLAIAQKFGKRHERVLDAIKKLVHQLPTDTQHNFVLAEYADEQGSTHADKYYMAITKMEYAALELVKAASDKHFRDSLDCFQHGQLTVVEMAAQRALAYGMAAGMHYKAIYQHCKECCLELARSLRKLLPANEPAMRLVAGGEV